MVRRYKESIEVRAGEGAVGFHRPASGSREMAATSGPAVSRDVATSPSAFLWRGRLYIVREVIGHWRERRAWWRDALDPDEEALVAHRSDSHNSPASPAPAHSKVCLEQEVWRVEASPGRLAGTGVYDLAMSGRTWRLLRVAD